MSKLTPLVEERVQARANKDFARSDEIRDILHEQHIELEDSANGTLWSRK